jgi:hypothetical protein
MPEEWDHTPAIVAENEAIAAAHLVKLSMGEKT